MIFIKTFGRTVIKANITEEQLLSGSIEEIAKRVLDILNNSIEIHNQNHDERLYLKAYLYGDQDIYRDKKKYTRKEIDNRTVENWAYAMVDFKKTHLLGKAIQYVQLDDSGEEEIACLNKYTRYVKKQAKDQMLYEDVLACGSSYIFVDAVDEKTQKEKGFEAPFQLINTPVEDTEVVYSSKLGGEQLLSFIQTSMQFIDSQLNEKTGKYEDVEKTYQEYTVYLRKFVLVFNNKSGTLEWIRDETKPLLTRKHRIIEYYTNRKRISLIELGKDLFNDINYLESMDKDDMEQFVNAIMVFTNAEIDEEGLSEMKDLGAVCINSTDNKKASIDLLQGRLNANDTQTYYTRLLNALHQILGVPRATDSGSIASGDTGKAKLTGQGFTSSGIRIEGEQCMFGMCDMETLEVILEICRNSTTSEITKLKVSDTGQIFQRDMTDNMLTKTQALQNLYSCDIPRKFANSIIGLFGDPNSVTKEQEKIFGAQASQTGAGKDKENSRNADYSANQKPQENQDNNKLNSNIQNGKEQQNKVRRTLQNDLQGK